MNSKISKIKKHFLHCDESKLDKESLEIFLIQNILAVVSFFEKSLKNKLSKESLKFFLDNQENIDDSKEYTYLTMMKKFLLSKDEFNWEIKAFTHIENKKVLLNWKTFYKDYLVLARNKGIHDFELDDKIKNKKLFEWFIDAVKDLLNCIVSFLNKIKIDEK